MDALALLLAHYHHRNSESEMVAAAALLELNRSGPCPRTLKFHLSTPSLVETTVRAAPQWGHHHRKSGPRVCTWCGTTKTCQWRWSACGRVCNKCELKERRKSRKRQILPKTQQKEPPSFFLPVFVFPTPTF